MDWGIDNRLSRIIQPDGRVFILPIDHGYFQGPTRCLEKPGETIAPLLPYADALFCTRGVLRSAVDPQESTPIILRVSGGTSVIGEDLANVPRFAAAPVFLRGPRGGAGAYRDSARHAVPARVSAYGPASGGAADLAVA